MRIKCPVCEHPLSWKEAMTDYGFFREEDNGLIWREWNAAVQRGDGYSIFCEEPGCAFKINDYPDLRDRIDNNLG